MILALIALAAAQPMSVGRDQSLPIPATTGGGTGLTRPAADGLAVRYEARAKALRQEMAALKRSDGKLTAEQWAKLRQRLVALLEAYERDVQRESR